jgi:hypothetical protein
VRAALLPTPGEPFMLAYWLRNFETWRDEVDELLVCVNGPYDQAYQMVADAGGRVMRVARNIGHGPAIDWLLTNTDADEIVLCEDDAYVRRPWAVGWTFEHFVTLRSTIVGSPRYEDNLADYVDWDRVTGGPEDLGRALWPAFLFARRRDLLDTDRRYGDVVIRLGQRIPGMGRNVTEADCAYVGTAPDSIHLDTFYTTTYQLRQPVELVHRTRLIDPAAVEDWLRYDPPWCHLSALSAIGMVLDGMTEGLPNFGPDGGDWPRRVAWWERTYRDSPELQASAYGSRYRDRLDTFRERTGLSDAAIEAWDSRFEPWVTW